MAASVARKGLPHFTGASFNGRTAFLYSAYIRSIRIAPTIGSVQAALPELFSPFWQSGKTLDGPDRRAHGAITQRQSTGFASRKLRVRIPFVPPIPKCPSLRMAMAAMPMSGERSCTLRQVPRSLLGRQGTTRKAKKWPPLRAARIAFGNGANARLAVHGCEKNGHSGSASASISVVQTHSS